MLHDDSSANLRVTYCPSELSCCSNLESHYLNLISKNKYKPLLYPSKKEGLNLYTSRKFKHFLDEISKYLIDKKWSKVANSLLTFGDG